MNIKSNAVLHNRFDIVCRNAKTGEVIQKAQAENIVLDRMYTRLCNFQTYFVNIVFGTGTGIPTASRDILFSRLGYKTAVDEEIVRSYPTSKWVKKIRLESTEYNGDTITEVGISEHTTNINTHAMITDAEGNLLSITKNSLMVVDIYATVFIEIPNVDSGLFYINNGWRDYLAGGGTAPSNVIRVATTKYEENPEDSLYGYTQTATRTVDVANKRVTVTTRLEAGTFNKEIQFVDWVGVGLRVKLPRTGIYEGTQRNNIQIGVGDGIKTNFSIPNSWYENLVITVDDVVVNNWEVDKVGIKFDTPVAPDLIVKASYKSLLIPKNSDNVFDISFTLQYDNLGSLPTPVEPITPPTPDFSIVHGSNTIVAGDSNYGFYGEVSGEDFISGDELANVIGLTAGTSQNSDAGWLKVVDGNKMLLIAKKTFRHTISWNDINAVDAVFGKIVTIDGVKYVLRLLSTAEWDRFMYPLHTSHPNGAPAWANYSDSDLLVSSSYGNGSYSWTSTPQSASRVYRGGSGVSYSNGYSPATVDYAFGWRPVLEFFT